MCQLDFNKESNKIFENQKKNPPGPHHLRLLLDHLKGGIRIKNESKNGCQHLDFSANIRLITHTWEQCAALLVGPRPAPCHSGFHLVLKERSVFLLPCGLLFIPFISVKRSLILDTHEGMKKATASRELAHACAGAYTCSHPGKKSDFVNTVVEPAFDIVFKK